MGGKEFDLPSFDQNQFYSLLQVALAMLLGALIGLDREAADKPAGLRMHMLVSGAAAFLVALGNGLAGAFYRELGSDIVRVDPVRIIEAVVTGIGFLGAGTIIRNRAEGDVQGLTTAASLLFSAAVGIAAALSQWTLALGGTALALVTLRLLPWLSGKITPGIRRDG